jgi:signal transduction histidine kinase
MVGQVLAQSRIWEQRTEATALRTLNRFAIELISIPNEDDLFWYVAQNVVGKLNFIDCVVYQANVEQTELKQVAAWGEKNPFGRSIVNPLIIPFGSGITGRVAASSKAVIADDILNDQNYILDTQAARSEICVPILLQGRIMGVIDSEHPNTNAFGEAELEILTTVAAMTAAKLDLLSEARTSSRRYEDIVKAHALMSQEVDARKALEARLFEARKMEAIGRMAGKFAHEFNNISTTVLGNLELLELELGNLEKIGPDGQASLQEVKNAAAKSVQLVRKMLAFAQRTRLVPSVVDLNSLVLKLCNDDFHRHAHRVEHDLEKELWPIEVDKSAIEQIVCHLVENAMDALAPGGVVKISTRNVRHSDLDHNRYGISLSAPRYMLLSVSDNGHGIPADRICQIFDPFFSMKHSSGKSGMGLSIVQGLVLQSSGCISVKSEVGKGSTFEVVLPAYENLEEDE